MVPAVMRGQTASLLRSALDATAARPVAISHPAPSALHLNYMPQPEVDPLAGPSSTHEASQGLDATPGQQARLSESDKLLLLDNPIWNALLTDHRAVALVNGPARRYPPAIGPLSGIPEQTEESYEALRTLAGPGGTLALFLQDPPAPPAGWTLIRTGSLVQMLNQGPSTVRIARLSSGITFRRLAVDDVPAMLELAELTEPGPFRIRTIELGDF